MHIHILGSELAEASPEAKYLLTRLLLWFGVNAEISWKVKVLAKKVGLSDRLVTRSVNELKRLGILSRAEDEHGARGGSSYRYKINLASVGALCGRRTKVYSVRQQQINHLLCASSNREYRLTALNKLLWAVLLLHADRFGVVRDLGFSELCRLTGFNPDRLKGQIAKLNSMSALRYVIPGLTERGPFGVIKARYYLNLNHKALGGLGDVSLIVLNDSLDKNLADYREAGVIAENVSVALSRVKRALEKNIKVGWRGANAGAMPPFSDFCEVANYFSPVSGSGWRQKRLVELLQCKLEEHASALISDYREDLSGVDASRAYIDLIRTDLLRSGLTKEHPGFGALAEFIFELSLCVARRYSHALGICLGASSEVVNFKGMRFLILPSFHHKQGQALGRVLLGVVEDVTSATRICFFYRDAGGCVLTRCFDDEFEIDRLERIRVNLQGVQTFPVRYGNFESI
ncbi:MarR family transcriptional regulator [Pseudomonas aeruginosa]|uniref:MarR family transcriptional regulator n=1 Tax=Pseudomonas aeruginosa TaxID=287 RepID=UPI00044C1467|nr:helix-turn-helix domain-containing protein [Pseudomonas aeruginosa]EZO27025.1 hypothetical protein AJ62_01637 [Pseudomonas aeruginosa 3575]MDJ1426724.1 hypothetical protein [Pseudomonas aeruginosa]RTT16905.1 hypothetical protein DY955_15790 [Pseudomonas aeruginosa]HEH8637658.1 hypothetical protein [Pseudomonas aeruginosa]